MCHYRKPPILPDNFRYIQIDEHETEPWCDAQAKLFKRIKDDKFLLLLDDYWLVKPVNTETIKRLYDLVEDDVVKMNITEDVKSRVHAHYLPGILISDQGAKYRTSLQPAIWSKCYYMRHLKPGRSIWEFEQLGQREAVNDGCNILGVDRDQYCYANMYRKGLVSEKGLNKIHAADMAHMRCSGFTRTIDKTTLR